ncbi:MAG: hypothetical protein RI924_1124, partial [Bacteroidota bacterium]
RKIRSLSYKIISNYCSLVKASISHVMKKYLFSLLGILLTFIASSQPKPAYVLYTASGKKADYGKMVEMLSRQDIVLIGEFHNNPISHWMELEITKDCQQKRDLVLGAEMFEQDNQQALYQYLAGQLTAKGLDTAARLWKNYTTDYSPLVNFAKDQKLSFVATNVPRKYASMVSKAGFEALNNLTDQEKSWLAPLPILYDPELPGYKNMMTMMAGHATANMPKAQALKDATMGYFILKNWSPGKLFIHYNGSYHSDNHDGIVWYLKQANPKLKIATVTTVSQKELKYLLAEHKNKADFIICVDEDMTTTY